MSRLRLFVVLFALVVVGSLPLGAKGLHELRVVCTNDWVYEDEAFFNVMLAAGERGASGKLTLAIATDKGFELEYYEQSYQIAAGEPCQVQFLVDDLDAGFYIATLYDDGVKFKSFNFGVRPDEISSPRDAKADFWSFWQQ